MKSTTKGARPWGVLFAILLFSATLPTLVLASNVPYWGPLLSCVGNYDPVHNQPIGPVSKTCTSLCDILETAQNVINFLITVTLFVLSPIFFLWGGFRIMFSAGSPEGLKEGKRILTVTLIGVLITLFAYVIIDTFLWGLGVATGTGAAVSWPNIPCTP